MKVEIQNNQTLLDVAVKYYGSADAIGELLLNNPTLQNDAEALLSAGCQVGEFRPDIKLSSGSMVLIDTDSRLIKKTVIKKITSNVNTYTTKEWQEQLNR